MIDVLDTALPRGGSVELRMDARPENLVLARLAVAGVAAHTALTEEDVADLKLAVTEACTNAIDHGYSGGASGDEVVVRVAIDDTMLFVEVQDWGIGFDADEESRPVDEMRDHAGVGLSLIRSLSDKLILTSSSSGSLVVFAKRLNRPD
jgi:serine/threonine-protein kinase RsbW